MIRRLFVLLAALTITATSAVAIASDFRPIRAGEPATIRSDRAYILIRCQAAGKCVPPVLLRLPSEEELFKFEEDKKIAYARQKKKGDYASFAFTPAEEENTYVPVAKTFFDVASDKTSFLIEAKPGTYVVYGIGIKPVFLACFCLGTVKAEAKAGTITDFGTSFVGRAADPSPYPALAEVTNKGKSLEMDFPVTVGALVPAAADTWRPAAIAGRPVTLAQFHAVAPYYDPNARSPTHLPAIPGVLEYHRGRVIDARTGEELPDFIP